MPPASLRWSRSARQALAVARAARRGAGGRAARRGAGGCAKACALLALLACTPSSRPEPAPLPEAAHGDGVTPAPAGGADAAPLADAAPAEGAADAAPPDASPMAGASRSDGGSAKRAPADRAGAAANVKVVTIGMHVGGGPFDEITKEPFKKAVEPHFPALATCWAEHLQAPPRQIDVGVDLLIEASGGKPAVSNPRSTLEKSAASELLPCVIAVFASVDFPKLERGRSGVSYSVRFTKK